MIFSRQQLAIAIGVGMLVTFLASAIKGSYQVYFLDLANSFGMGRGTFALTGAMFGLSIGLVSPVVGWVCDRYGAANTILSGAVVACFVFLALAMTQSYWLFLILYGFMAAYAFAAMTFVPLGLLIDQIFSEQNKGMAFAAITNGTAIGFMVLSPLWVWLNAFMSWNQISFGISVAFLFLVIPCVVWLSHVFPHKPNTECSEDVVTEESSLIQELAKAPFQLLAISFAGCGVSMAYIDVHLVPLIQGRLAGVDSGTQILASTLSSLGAAELLGAFLVGWMLRFSKPALLLVALYAVRGLSLLLILNSSTLVNFLSFSILFGLTYMGTVIITSLICLQIYGEKIKGKMFGFLFLVHQIAVFATIWLGGIAFDLTHSYELVTLGVSSFCFASVIAGLILHWLFQKPESSDMKFDSHSQKLP
ncbi:MAG: MFS family permease [Oleispira sp.]|jgi:MFS family permease